MEKGTEEYREYMRDYYRKWREGHPNYYRDYRRKRKDELSKYTKKHREKGKGREVYLGYQGNYYKINGERIRNQVISNRRNIKEMVLTHYGNGHCICVRCGFDDIRALSIDHIDNNGSEERKRTGVRGGLDLYRKLRDAGFPEGYQTLCYNCNIIKHMEYTQHSE